MSAISKTEMSNVNLTEDKMNEKLLVETRLTKIVLNKTVKQCEMGVYVD